MLCPYHKPIKTPTLEPVHCYICKNCIGIVARIVNGIVSEKAKMYSFSQIVSRIKDGIITGIVCICQI